MSHYGHIIEDINPVKDIMYESFVKFFKNPYMVKIKDVEKYSMYMTKTYCLLNKECRYLIVFINVDGLPVGAKEYLNDLKWISFQTRTLEDKHDLPPHSYNPKRGGPLSEEIDRIQITEKTSEYKCKKFPLKITLLHKKEGESEYQDKGNIIAALETYNTILTLTSDI